MKDDHLYRPCAGIMLLNAESKIFVGQRIDQNKTAWQMPQGGIDDGETSLNAAFRELKEEIGTDKATLIKSYQETLYYDLPNDLATKLWNGRYKGQKQYWFLMRFDGTDSDIHLETEYPEFSDFRWISPEELLLTVVPFKKDIYQILIDHLYIKISE